MAATAVPLTMTPGALLRVSALPSKFVRVTKPRIAGSRTEGSVTALPHSVSARTVATQQAHVANLVTMIDHTQHERQEGDLLLLRRREQTLPPFITHSSKGTRLQTLYGSIPS